MFSAELAVWKQMIKKTAWFFFLPESIHHIFYWQDCYHWLIYILQQRKYINNSWRRLEELLFSFFNLGGQGRRKVWKSDGGMGASSNRRSYNGTGFASIFAKIFEGNWPSYSLVLTALQLIFLYDPNWGGPLDPMGPTFRRPWCGKFWNTWACCQRETKDMFRLILSKSFSVIN